MTAKNKLKPSDHSSLEATVRYLHSTPRPWRCICCPDEPAHVFAYAADIDHSSATPALSTHESHQDWMSWINDRLSQSPNGARIRISFEVLPEETT